MERLLKDAEKITGKKYDLSSYADIVEAIHAVQTEMGITGTTAEEAEKTIEGSTRSMKAAWQNLLVSFATGKDVSRSFNKFTKSAKNVIKNVTPVVSQALKGIGQFVAQIGPMIVQELPGLMKETLPALLNAVGALGRAIVTSLPGIMDAIWTSLTGLDGPFSGLFGNVGAAWDSAKQKLSGAITYIRDTFLPDIKGAIEGATGENGIDWGKLWEGLGNIDLVQKIKDVFAKVPGQITALLADGASFTESGAFAGFADSFFSVIESAFTVGAGGGAAKIIGAIAGLFTPANFTNYLTIGTDVGTVIVGAVGKAIEGVTTGATMLVNSVKSLFSQAVSAITSDQFKLSADAAAQKIIGAIVTAISSAGSKLVDLTGAVTGLLGQVFSSDTITGLFGESGTVTTFGKNIVQGIIDGIGTAQDAAIQIATKITEFLTGVDWSQTGETLTTAARGLIDQLFAGLAQTDFETVASKIGELLGAALSAVSNLGVGIGNAIANWFVSGEIFTTLYNVADIIVSGLWSFVTGLLGSIWDNSIIVQKVRELGDLIGNYVNGLAYDNTIETNVELDLNTVFDPNADLNTNQQAQGLASSIWEQVKAGIHDGKGRGEIETEIASMLEEGTEGAQDILKNSDFFNTVTALLDEQFAATPIEPEMDIEPKYEDSKFEQMAKEAHDKLKSAVESTSGENADPAVVVIDAQTSIDEAVTTVKAGVETLKGLMKFEWSLPHIKLPHFKINGAFDPSTGSVPEVSVDWYAKAMNRGMILDKPTLFGAMNGQLLGAGEAGPEAVVGVSSLDKMINDSVSRAVAGVLDRLDKIIGGQGRGNLQVVLDTGVLVGEINNGLGEVQAWRGAGRA